MRFSRHQWHFLPFLSVVIGTMFISAEADSGSTIVNEYMETVMPVSPIAANATPADYKFISDCVYSRSIFTNERDKHAFLEITDGAIGWNFANYSKIPNVMISDNLGNNFKPIITNKTVSNSEAVVLLPPHHKYKLYISYCHSRGLSFDDENGEYLYRFKINFGKPTNLVLRFPNDFTS